MTTIIFFMKTYKFEIVQKNQSVGIFACYRKSACFQIFCEENLLLAAILDFKYIHCIWSLVVST